MIERSLTESNNDNKTTNAVSPANAQMCQNFSCVTLILFAETVSGQMENCSNSMELKAHLEYGATFFAFSDL